MGDVVRAKAEMPPFWGSDLRRRQSRARRGIGSTATAWRRRRTGCRPGGHLVIPDLDWIGLPGNVVEATENLALKHNPKWSLIGSVGIYPRDGAIAGLVDMETLSFDVPYTMKGGADGYGQAREWAGRSTRKEWRHLMRSLLRC
jgi:hypothetical protein